MAAEGGQLLTVGLRSKQMKQSMLTNEEESTLKGAQSTYLHSSHNLLFEHEVNVGAA
jgi:hypothetical protein